MLTFNSGRHYLQLIEFVESMLWNAFTAGSSARELEELRMYSYRNSNRLLAMLGALFSVGSISAASSHQIREATTAIKIENVRGNPHRGVGPWATRRAGWRQAQRRKWARRVGR